MNLGLTNGPTQSRQARVVVGQGPFALHDTSNRQNCYFPTSLGMGEKELGFVLSSCVKGKVAVTGQPTWYSTCDDG